MYSATAQQDHEISQLHATFPQAFEPYTVSNICVADASCASLLSGGRNGTMAIRPVHPSVRLNFGAHNPAYNLLTASRGPRVQTIVS